MNLFEILSAIEADDSVCLGRLLMLLYAFESSRGESDLDSISKLGKLDYLLEYPVVLERVLTARGVRGRPVSVRDFEVSALSTKMSPFAYAPWSPRYSTQIAVLVARGLVAVSQGSRKIQLTATGRDLALRLSSEDALSFVYARARLIKRHLNLSGRRLGQFLRETLPELSTLEVRP